jgi:diguanylate cyclase (GGDEF)-like protein
LGVSFVNIATGAFDYQPPPYMLPDFLCRLVISLMFLLSAPAIRLQLFRNRAQYVIILPCLLMVAMAGAFGLLTHDAVALDRKVSMTIVAVYTAVLFVEIDMRQLIFLGISSICVAAFFLAACGGNSIHDQLQLIVFYGLTMFAIFRARKVQNIYHYQNFLLRTREEINIQAAINRSALLSQLAYTDKLTEVPNRRYFDEICASMSDATKNLHPLAVCIIDIDHFKKLNDSLGHLQGDRCLHVVAAALRNALSGGSDILARYGGEEFIVLLPNTKLADALDVVERMREAVLNLRHPNPGTAARVVTASFGVSTSEAAPLCIEDLIAQADAALYRAKARGRNCVVS